MPPEIVVCRDGIPVLGTAVGSDTFVNSYVHYRVDKIAESVVALSLLQNLHLKYALVKACVGLPKFAYVLQTTSPDSIRSAIDEFDNVI